jgi:hypothetical protein
MCNKEGSPMTERAATGSTRLESVPTETAHGRTPAVDRPALTPPPAGSPSGGERSRSQIERDIEVTRERLATTIDEIGDRVKPANVVRRGRESLVAQVRTPDGQLRTERVAPLAAAVGVLFTLMVARRVRARRR